MRGALLSLCLASVASAQAPAEESSYRERFAQAMEHSVQGRFADAAAIFEALYREDPRPPVVFNLATVERGRGDYARAEALLERLLRGEFGVIAEAQQAEAEALLASVQTHIGTLVLEVAGPASLRAAVAGREVLDAPGRAELRLDAGDHPLRVEAAGHVPVARSVRIAGGERTELTLTLRPRQPARLVLEADEDTLLEIVGVAEGRGRLERDLEPGEYVVRARRGSASTESTLQLDWAERTRLELDLPHPRRGLRIGMGIGAAALAIAGGAIAAWLLTRDGVENVEHPWWGTAEALRAFPPPP